MPTRWKSSGLIKGNSITCATATKTWHASNARVAQNHAAHETKNGPTVQAGVMTSRNSRICSFKPVQQYSSWAHFSFKHATPQTLMRICSPCNPSLPSNVIAPGATMPLHATTRRE